jgi:hypothetical protein
MVKKVYREAAKDAKEIFNFCSVTEGLLASLPAAEPGGIRTKEYANGMIGFIFRRTCVRENLCYTIVKAVDG